MTQWHFPSLKNIHNAVKIDSVLTKRLQFEKRKLFVTEGWSFKSASWELGLDVCISSKVQILTVLIEPGGGFSLSVRFAGLLLKASAVLVLIPVCIRTFSRDWSTESSFLQCSVLMFPWITVQLGHLNGSGVMEKSSSM